LANPRLYLAAPPVVSVFPLRKEKSTFVIAE
jgi:hypothetical protein